MQPHHPSSIAKCSTAVDYSAPFASSAGHSQAESFVQLARLFHSSAKFRRRPIPFLSPDETLGTLPLHGLAKAASNKEEISQWLSECFYFVRCFSASVLSRQRRTIPALFTSPQLPRRTHTAAATRSMIRKSQSCQAAISRCTDRETTAAATSTRSSGFVEIRAPEIGRYRPATPSRHGRDNTQGAAILRPHQARWPVPALLKSDRPTIWPTPEAMQTTSLAESTGQPPPMA